MALLPPPSVTIAAAAMIGLFVAWSPSPGDGSRRGGADDDGYAIRNETVINRCSRCHVADDEGRMTRISYLRKTPEGWQTSVRRMVALHGVRLNTEDASAIVRYLADEQGLAPEELRPGRFEVERRMIDHDYEGDSDVEFTCIQCHSMGRVITQRRTEQEWALLLSTHRALYPLVDFQAFRRPGPPPEEGDPRHPMDRAITHLSDVFPLQTPEWSAWAATKRPPRLAGTWALSGYEPGKGPLYGTVTITADRTDPGSFTTSSSYVYAESGERASRSGRGLVYTGYQWRGRSNPDGTDELREVMFVERDQRAMSGRWFRGDYDELGPDVTLRRVAGETVVTGVYPGALERGSTVDVRVFGGELAATSASELDFGAGVTVASVDNALEGELAVRLTIAPDAPIGARDVFARGGIGEAVVVVHDGIDRLEVTPRTGMSRVGGAAFPKGYETFEAIGWNDGPDGEPETEDDLQLGRVPVSWRVEEYAAVYGDDDIRFVGTMGQDGVFVPALDGPNPDRSGDRNNVGDVWVVATHDLPDGRPLTARAHLVVTVPLYMRFEPWRPIDDGRRPVGDR